MTNNPEVSPATLFALLVLISGMAFGQDKPKWFSSTAISANVVTPPAAASFMDTIAADGTHDFNIHDPKNEWICRISAFSPPPGNNPIHPNEPTGVTIVCLKKQEAVHEPK